MVYCTAVAAGHCWSLLVLVLVVVVIIIAPHPPSHPIPCSSAPPNPGLLLGRYYSTTLPTLLSIHLFIPRLHLSLLLLDLLSLFPLPSSSSPRLYSSLSLSFRLVKDAESSQKSPLERSNSTTAKFAFVSSTSGIPVLAHFDLRQQRRERDISHLA